MERCSKSSPEANVHRGAWQVFWAAFVVLTAVPSPLWAEWECPKGRTVPAGPCCVTAWHHHCSSWFSASIHQCPSTEAPGSAEQCLGSVAGQQGLCCLCRLCQTPRAMCAWSAQEYNVPPWLPSGAGPGWDSPFKRQSKLLVSLDKPKEKKKIKKTKLTAIKSRSYITSMLEYMNYSLSHYHPCIPH